MVSPHHFQKNRLLALVSLVLLFSASPLLAITQLNARVDKNPLMMGEELILQVQADEKVSADKLDFSVLQHDFRLSPASVSQSMQIINGQSNQSTTWQISLFARKTGQITIPSFQIDGVKSDAITLDVLPAAQHDGTTKADLFLEVALTPSKLYVQQMGYYEVKIYFKGDLQRGSLSQPELSGAQIEQVGKDIESTELVNGERYQSITRRYSVIPQQSGDFKLIGPFFKGDMIDRNSNNYDYYARSKTVSAEGQTLSLNVLPIPQQFNGDWLVSDLVALTEEWTNQSNQLVQGEPVTRTITLTALDLADHQLPDLPIQNIAGLKLYAEQPQSKKAERNGRIVAQKVFSVAVIANQAGDIMLPEIQIPWWNSKTNQAEMATLPARTLKVSANPEQANQATAANTAPVGPQNTVKTAVLTEQSPWQLNQLALVLLIGWLSTLALWLVLFWRQRQTATTAATATASSAASTVRFNPARLRAACQSNDVNLSKQLLIRWANQQWSADITEINQLLPLIATSPFKSELKQLCYSGYQATPQPWQGNNLFAAWSEYSHQQLKQKIAGPLKPLYPLQ